MPHMISKPSSADVTLAEHEETNSTASSPTNVREKKEI